MEPWGTAIFLLLLAFAVVALGAIVTRMVKSIDPNDAAGLLPVHTVISSECVTCAQQVQDEKNEKTWAWRLSALEARVQQHYEHNRKATKILTDTMNTIARTSGNMDVENGEDIEYLSKKIDRAFDAIAALAEAIAKERQELRGLIALSADKSRTALQTANEALVVANTTETDIRRVIDSATLRAALEVYRHAELNDSTPEDDSEEERVAAIEVDGYCVHGNPVQFHYEGGCDT